MALMQWLDYVILVAFFMASLGIGIYHSLRGGRQKTVQEFIMADRKLSVIPTVLSLTASYQSAIMILGNTAEFYNWGAQAWILGVFTNAFSLILVERLIVPWLYPLSLTSVYEYLEMRYKSRSVAMLGSAIGIIKANLYMGIAMYAPSLALESVCGLPTKISIPLMAVLCTVYTTLGGMKAVIWTDVMQILIMAGGILTVLIKAAIDVGGAENAFHLAGEEGRLYGVNFSGDFTTRHTFWGFLFGSSFQLLLVYGIQQASVQRYSAVSSIKEARIVMLLKIPVSSVMSSLAFLTGVMVFGFFASARCDPLANGDVTSSNQILSYFVGRSFRNSIGFNGLFLSTLYSGALSSVSSSLSGSAANTWKGILVFILPKMNERKAAIVNKILVICYGVLATAIAFIAATMPGPVSQIAMTFSGAVGGPLLGLFLLGGLFQFTEWKGALLGTVCGLLMNFFVVIGSRFVPPVNQPLPSVAIDGCTNYLNTSLALVASNTTEALDMSTKAPYVPQGINKLFSISYMWYTPMSLIITLTIGCLASFLIRYFDKQQEPVPSKYLLSLRNAFTLCDPYKKEGEGRSKEANKPKEYEANDILELEQEPLRKQ